MLGAFDPSDRVLVFFLDMTKSGCWPLQPTQGETKLQEEPVFDPEQAE
jgi:hypothetical protein